MPRKRFLEIAPERRDRILAAAAEEFAVHGYAAASVNRIIEQAGISKGSLYYYFDDKDDLFAAVMEQAIGRLMGEVWPDGEGALTAGTFWNTFRETMRRSMEVLERDEWYVRLLRSFHQLRATARSSPAAQRVVDLISEYIRGILVQGQALGVVRTDVPLPLLVEVTLAVDEAADRWRVEHWEGLAPAERIAHADTHIDLMRDMLDAENQGWEG